MTTLLSVPFVPFSLALGLIAALMLTEALALMLGFSLLGQEDGLPDAGTDLAGGESPFDFDADTTPDVAELLAASDAIDQPAPAQNTAQGSGLFAVLGLGQAPFMIWFAALLLGFGVTGFALQSVLGTVTGGHLPLEFAVPAALAFGLAFARKFARLFHRLLPSIETTATSAQFLGGLRGVVTQGIARKGSAAEVRLRDRHGNLHFMRCEPFRDTDIIPEGSEVLTLRLRLGQGRYALRILAIG